MKGGSMLKATLELANTHRVVEKVLEQFSKQRRPTGRKNLPLRVVKAATYKIPIL